LTRSASLDTLEVESSRRAIDDLPGSTRQKATTMRPILASALILGFGLTGNASAAGERVDYLRDVKPILARRCYACHGALKQRAGLRLDTAAFIRQGGDHGPAIIAGASSSSLLIERITGAGKSGRMPPASEGEPLKEREIAQIRAWINQGAIAPADEKPEADPKDHWAFRAPMRPALPAVRNPAWVRNAIDAFIAAEQDRRGLVPQPPADRRTLLRRVYLDLIGLPPTRVEQAAFLADPAPDAYEKVVDRLLASPQYGERWGRHWMDIWRYSDWWGLGAEVRNSQKHIWHWRDWIIESLNADKGYDQMIREMLAADELYPDDLDRLRATGFLARQYFRFNRNSWLDETVEHTSKAFLGLTLNCAKCHDHKFDPIAQADYYRMRAFFEPYQLRIDELPGEVDLEKDGLPRAFDCNLDAPTYRFVRGDEKQPVKSKPLAPGVPALLALGDLDIHSVHLPAVASFPGLRSFVLADHLRAAERRIAAARQALTDRRNAGGSAPEQGRAEIHVAEKALAAAEAQPAALRARAAADWVRLQQPTAENARELARQACLAERRAALAQAEADLARAELDCSRADAKQKPVAEKKRTAAREAVDQARKALEAPGDTYTPLRGALKTPESNLETEASRSKPFPTTSTGRRSALAQWLTDPHHPLTARVAMNHVWARHFGRPLVATVFDFGRKGAAPTHPALLDYLALELRDSGWSLKHLHRLIVTSNTYRLSSSTVGAPSVNRTIDAENRYYWHRDSMRMEAQVVRDSLLHLAGELDATMGGPSIPVQNEASRRRSLYFVHSHNEHHKFLAMFDDAGVLECYRRSESIVPQQALALENSKLTLSAAERIAGRISQDTHPGSDEQFVRSAFETVLGCIPTAEEQAECERALKQLAEIFQKQKQAAPIDRARVALIAALLNHNDFITIR
jgi:hypothetical protein